MPKRNAEKSPVSRTQLLFARFCLGVAFAISAFLAWTSLQGGNVPGCGPDSLCDKVLSSRWSYFLGLPVSLLALPVYLALLLSTFGPRLRWPVVLPLTFIVLAAALWFIGLQAFTLRAFCKFCMSAHAAGLFAALILLSKSPLDTRATAISLGVAALAFTILVAGQYASTQPGPLTVSSSDDPTTESQLPQPVVEQPIPTFSVVEGQFTLNLNEVPVSGSVEAPYKIVKLFDYTCRHCRDLHHLLHEYHARHRDALAVISLVMPLDGSCNSVVRRTAPDHVNACEYARYGLAVFLADPEKIHAFSDFLFAPQRPPDLAAARAQAEALVGATEFATALNDPRIDQQIQRNIEIYVASSRKAGRGSMPQMLFERGGSIGAVRGADQLEQILREQVGIGAPAPGINPL